MLLNSVLNEDRRARLESNYSKLIASYKLDLMSLNLNTMETIRRGYCELLVDLQKQIPQLCTDAILQAIRNHQHTMQKRHQKFLEHTLSTFFDDASIASEEKKENRSNPPTDCIDNKPDRALPTSIVSEDTDKRRHKTYGSI